MSMKDVLALEDGAKWEEHLKKSYNLTAEQHSDSWKSWGWTRVRRGNRLDTAVNAVGQGGAAIPATAGALAGAGVAVPAAFGAGVAGGAAAAAAITLWALPAVITGGVLIYWGYQKHEHHKVNVAIWKWWCENCQKSRRLGHDAIVELDTAKEWLAWFGDEGIGNMNHLKEKLDWAKDAFDHKFRNIDQSRSSLINRIQAAQRLPKGSPQKKTTLQNLSRELDDLANKYLELGKDLEYIRYRLAARGRSRCFSGGESRTSHPIYA